MRSLTSEDSSQNDSESSATLLNTKKCIRLGMNMILKFLLPSLIRKLLTKRLHTDEEKEWGDDDTVGDFHIPKKDTEEEDKMSKSDLARELYRRVVRNFRKRKVIIRHLDEIWAADTMHMLKFVEENQLIERRGRPRKGLKKKKSPVNYSGFKYILVVIDCFSKFLWLIPMKDKTGIETSRALENYKVFEEDIKVLMDRQG